jgi:hypothetical protein
MILMDFILSGIWRQNLTPNLPNHFQIFCAQILRRKSVICGQLSSTKLKFLAQTPSFSKNNRKVLQGGSYHLKRATRVVPRLQKLESKLSFLGLFLFKNRAFLIFYSLWTSTCIPLLSPKLTCPWPCQESPSRLPWGA